MQQIIKTCDIQERTHSEGFIENLELQVIFDHDQEDGRSKVSPYLQKEKIDICKSCKEHMLKERRYIYAYGVMGHNKYYL